MTDDVLDDYFTKLSQADIKNIKPEFLTVDISNLAFLSQFVQHFNPELIKELLEVYINPENQNHRKQRFRLAPDRTASMKMLHKIRKYAQKYGITISICNWVKKEIGTVDPSIKQIDRESKKNGYRCLGYQTSILEEKQD